MEERIEKHTLSSGQDIERRETNTSTLVKREGGIVWKRHASVSKLPDLRLTQQFQQHTVHLITLNTSSQMIIGFV